MRYIKYLLIGGLPTICSYLCLIAFVEFLDSAILTILIALLCYLLTFIYIALYIRNKYAKIWLLPVSFFIAPLPGYVIDYFNGGFLQYLFPYYILILFSLPFSFITTIIIVLYIKNKCRKMWILPVSFFVVSLLGYLFDYFNGKLLQYLFPYYAGMIYVLSFSLIIMIILIYLKVKKGMED